MNHDGDWHSGVPSLVNRDDGIHHPPKSKPTSVMSSTDVEFYRTRVWIALMRRKAWRSCCYYKSTFT